MPGPNAFTTRQAAEVLGISVQAVHYLIRRGRLRAWCFGDRLCVSRRSVYSYLALRETMKMRRQKEQRIADEVMEELKRRRKRDTQRW